MYEFADLPWGSSYRDLEARLAERGYAFGGITDRGQPRVVGRLLGEDAVVHTQFAGEALARVNLILLPPVHRVRAVYGTLKSALVKKYGEPDEKYGFFLDPYSDGDGSEEAAFSAGKAVFNAFWLTDPDAAGHALWIRITEQMAVSVNYQGPHGSAELDRKQEAELDIL